MKLIQLELKKYKLRTMLITSLTITLSILGFILMISFVEKAEGVQTFADYAEIFTVLDLLIRVSFVIYASVLISKFVIEEYKNRTITLLFSYPISRKKLFFAKLSIIFVFKLVSIPISNLIASAAFLFIAGQFELMPGSPSQELIRGHAVNVLVQSVAAAGISLIPMFFGMIRKSVPATIVSSVLIVAVLNSTNNDFSLASIIAIPITLACVGIFVAWVSIRKVNQDDVM